MIFMGYAARKTEHAGAKRGRGAYWGPKQEAKKQSNRIRRENTRREIRSELDASSDGSKPSGFSPNTAKF